MGLFGGKLDEFKKFQQEKKNIMSPNKEEANSFGKMRIAKPGVGHKPLI